MFFQLLIELYFTKVITTQGWGLPFFHFPFANYNWLFDLRKLSEQRDKCFEEISQYYQLKSIIENINKDEKSLHTQVDLGCNFYAQAVM